MKRLMVLILASLAMGFSARAQDAGWSHNKFIRGTLVPNAVDDGDESTGALPVTLYQKHISPVLGGKCPMEPSCSAYAREAIEKHGPVEGWILTCDRLMRCGRDEINQSKSIRINHNTLCHDPVTNNDFWMK